MTSLIWHAHVQSWNQIDVGILNTLSLTVMFLPVLGQTDVGKGGLEPIFWLDMRSESLYTPWWLSLLRIALSTFQSRQLHYLTIVILYTQCVCLDWFSFLLTNLHFYGKIASSWSTEGVAATQELVKYWNKAAVVYVSKPLRNGWGNSEGFGPISFWLD